MARYIPNWPWVALNLSAVGVVVFILTQGSNWWIASDTFDSKLESGKWAIRFLIVCLAMTPVQIYLGWAAAVKLRKPAGLWAFGFALLHVGFYVSSYSGAWNIGTFQPYMVIGALGLLILTALALTSNRWAMQRLRKNWKRLHRLVYLAAGFGATHAILASLSSKRMAIRDPQAIKELSFAAVLLGALLIVRIPHVRQILQPLALPFRRQAKTQSVAVEKPIPDYRPIIIRPQILSHPSTQAHISIDEPSQEKELVEASE